MVQVHKYIQNKIRSELKIFSFFFSKSVNKNVVLFYSLQFSINLKTNKLFIHFQNNLFFLRFSFNQCNNTEIVFFFQLSYYKIVKTFIIIQTFRPGFASGYLIAILTRSSLLTHRGNTFFLFIHRTLQYTKPDFISKYLSKIH